MKSNTPDRLLTLFMLFAPALCVLAALMIQSVLDPVIAIIWSLTYSASGTVLGFLFGIPKILQTSKESDQPSEVKALRNYRALVNTNLEQISDWLTKIIVGVGLIQLQNLPALLKQVSYFMAQGMMLNKLQLAQAQTLSLAILIFFVVNGFASGYIATRILVARLFTQADNSMSFEENDQAKSPTIRQGLE